MFEIHTEFCKCSFYFSYHIKPVFMFWARCPVLIIQSNSLQMTEQNNFRLKYFTRLFEVLCTSSVQTRSVLPHCHVDSGTLNS